MRISLMPAAIALALCGAAPVAAAEVVFTGTRFNIDSAGTPSARCGARFTASIRNDPPTAVATGTSNFGNFTPTMSHCITLPLSTTTTNVFDLGEFVFTFDDASTLIGTYDGVVTAVSPGVFNIMQTHLVTGGTGFFAGSSGSFLSSGTLSLMMGRPPTVNQSFEGRIDVPAVPEPATWAMMILGFGAIGAAMRSRRSIGTMIAAG